MAVLRAYMFGTDAKLVLVVILDPGARVQSLNEELATRTGSAVIFELANSHAPIPLPTVRTAIFPTLEHLKTSCT